MAGLLVFQPKIRACRVCGCTDDRLCRGGCWWVEWDLCSACRETAYAKETPDPLGPRPPGFVPAGCLRCRRPVLVNNNFRPPLLFDPLLQDKGRPDDYFLFTHDCPAAKDEFDDDDAWPDEWFEPGEAEP